MPALTLAGDDRAQCAGGDARACVAIADRLFFTDADTAGATSYYQRACELADDYACAALGMMGEAGAQQPGSSAPRQGSPKVTADRPAASGPQALGADCEGGSARACASLGFYHERQDPDQAKALRLYVRACDLGYGFGCSRAGFLSLHGKRVDYQAAARLYGKGCRLGNQFACGGLGLLYKKGQGVPRNPAKAAEIFSKGCERGNAFACTNLGFLCRQGLGVKKSLDQARALFKKGCGLGNRLACTEAKRR
ncbi:MAG: sel1 repeat family protein [Succinivibrionaceae bacterium]|nr:sel1 repeat family protein [Succinivibrionaceae bacterium]